MLPELSERMNPPPPSPLPSDPSATTGGGDACALAARYGTEQLRATIAPSLRRDRHLVFSPQGDHLGSSTTEHGTAPNRHHP